MPAERVAPSDEAGLAQLLDQYLSSPRLAHGQLVSGTIVRVSPSEVIVDVNAKCEGIVPERDLERLSAAERNALRVGDAVMACVVTPEDPNGNIILSLSRARMARDWLEAQRLLESQETVEKEVVDANKGGLIVALGHLRGFVPGSQLVSPRGTGPGQALSNEERWAGMIGRKIRLRVIEVDQPRNRLIFSERAAVRDAQGTQRAQILDELTAGDVRRGRVVNLATFGAFVDLGGVDGLVHLSEISWQRVQHPREVLEVGQEVEVYVLGVDRERQRVALSLKRLKPDPWSAVDERYQVGQLVQAVVTRLTKWGAFASIVGDEAIEGLIHVSELGNGPVAHPRDVIQPDQVLTLRVIGVDAAHHRLALSLRQVADEHAGSQDWRADLSVDTAALDRSLAAAFGDAAEGRRSAQAESGLRRSM